MSSTSNMQIKTLDPQSLMVFFNERDVLRDLHTYLDYVSTRSIKRMTRSNEIPRADLIRLAKLLDVDPPKKDDWMYDSQHWIDFIDELALRLDLVSYDLKGEYRGYTSSSPSFIDNYIIVSDENYRKFNNLAPVDQEKRILDELINARRFDSYRDHSNNEFYQVNLLGSLDAFNQRGSGTGLMPMLKFPEIRLFLLEILNNLPAGQWFSTESFVAYLKANHPYFLIPQETPKIDKWKNPIHRYGNFYEGKDSWYTHDKPIPDDAPDGFERVEGRYVERFLENIPLTMRFVEVAYDPKPYKGPLPSRGILKAFRVTERFRRLMSNAPGTPKVTIQPNFDVVIESDFYPAALISQIAELGEQVSSPNNGYGAYVGIYLLTKVAVAAAQAKDPDLDIIQLLKDLSGDDLPPNVQIELEEWSGHAEQFTLYDGFSLLEMADVPPEIGKSIYEKISSDLHLVRDSKKVFSILETLGTVPIFVQHPASEFAPVAETAVSVFPKESEEAEAQKTPKQVAVSRILTVSYQFPDNESFESIQKTLAELRCPFQSNPMTRTVSIQQIEQDKFDKALEMLSGEFIFEFE